MSDICQISSNYARYSDPMRGGEKEGHLSRFTLTYKNGMVSKDGQDLGIIEGSIRTLVKIGIAVFM